MSERPSSGAVSHKEDRGISRENSRGSLLGYSGSDFPKKMPDVDEVKKKLADLILRKPGIYFKTPYPLWIYLIKEPEQLNPVRQFHNPLEVFNKDIYSKSLLDNFGIFDCNTLDSKVLNDIFKEFDTIADIFNNRDYKVQEVNLKALGKELEGIAHDQFQKWPLPDNHKVNTRFPDIAFVRNGIIHYLEIKIHSTRATPKEDSFSVNITEARAITSNAYHLIGEMLVEKRAQNNVVMWKTLGIWFLRCMYKIEGTLRIERLGNNLHYEFKASNDSITRCNTIYETIKNR